MKRSLLFVALAVLVSGGCKKSLDNLEKQGYESGHQKDKSKPDPALAGGGGGGGGGAVQAVRGAVTRDELLNALAQIRLFIDTASSDGNMPSVESTYAVLQKEAPKYAQYVADGKVVLNRATAREDVWAYAALPQGNYAVALASGVEQMDLNSLNRRLGR